MTYPRAEAGVCLKSCVVVGGWAVTAERMRELLGPYVRAPLGEEEIAALGRYLDLLTRWNARMNLTAVRRPEEIMTRHFGESLTVAEWLNEQGIRDKRQGTLFDLGSGAGFPGAVIALRCAEMTVTLIEAQQKKATFLKEIVRHVPIANCNVYAGRGEAMEARADFVTMRAVDKSGAMLQVAHGLLQAGGWLVWMGSAAQAKQVQAAGVFDRVEEVEAAAGVHVILGQRL